jgi:phosphocarrier protein HPr
MTPDNAPPESHAAGLAWLSHVGGLHARPAIKLTKLARRFVCEIRIGVGANGPWKDAKSIAQVLSMKVPVGTTVHFQADGPSSHEAIQALVTLVESDFNVASTPEQSDA